MDAKLAKVVEEIEETADRLNLSLHWTKKLNLSFTVYVVFPGFKEEKEGDIRSSDEMIPEPGSVRDCIEKAFEENPNDTMRISFSTGEWEKEYDIAMTEYERGRGKAILSALDLMNKSWDEKEKDE